MLRSMALILVLAIALTVLAWPSRAFSRIDNACLHSSVTIASPERRIMTLGADVEQREVTATAIDSRPSSTMTVDFAGKTSFASEPAPAIVGGDRSLRDFFDLSRSPRLFLRGAKGYRVMELGGDDVDSDVLGRYERMCSAVGACPPTPDDRFFDVITTSVKFAPGLRVMSAMTIGVKVAADAADFPRYEMVLIRDSIYAEGNRLFKWFFDRVTGKDTEDGSGEQTMRSLNTVRTIPAGEGAISFESTASLAVQIKFPSLLMKVIPGISREKIEKTGGKSLRKVLEADIPVSLENFRKEYVEWLDS